MGLLKFSGAVPNVGPNGANSGAGLDDFADKFSTMALSQLQKNFPEIVSRIGTFKTEKIDLEKGNAVGKFIITLDNATLFIPVIFHKNTILPLDTMYVEEMKAFLPFNKEWVDHISSMVDPLLGAHESDSNVAFESDPRNVKLHETMMPPRTYRRSVIGRTAYANSLEPVDAFLNFVDELPNDIKVAFFNTIKSNTPILKYSLDTFGAEDLKTAFAPHKTEKTARDKSRDVFLVNKDNTNHTTLVKLCKSFPKVAEELNKVGESVVDLRSGSINRIQRAADGRLYDTPQETGVYRVFLKNGEIVKALIVPKVDQARVNQYRGASVYDANNNQAKYLVLLQDGRACYVKNIISRHLLNEDPIEFAMSFITVSPKIGDTGTWLYFTHGRYEGTPIVTIDKVFAKGDTTRFFVNDKFGKYVVSMTAKSPYGKMHYSQHAQLLTVPSLAKFLRVNPHTITQDDFVTTFEGFDNVTKTASEGNLAIYAREGAYYLSNDIYGYGVTNSTGSSRGDFIVKLARDFSIPVNDAKYLVDSLNKSASDSYRFTIIPKGEFDRQLKEAAQRPAAQQQQQGGLAPDISELISAQNETIRHLAAALKSMKANKDAANANNPQDPSAGAMNPAMGMDMSQMAPQPPMSMAGQNMSNSGPMSFGGGAPPMDPSMMGGGMMPPQGGGMPMDPSMMGGMQQPGMQPGGMPMDPSMMGGMQQPGGMPMDPSMMGGMHQPGMQPGGMPMDPSMMGGMQQPGMQPGGMPMDPSMMGGMPPMTPEQEMMGQAMSSGRYFNANPELLEKVIELGVKGLFESASIASLGINRKLSNVVGKYMPMLQKSLDALGKLLFAHRYNADELIEVIGEDRYSVIINKMAVVFDELGSLIISIQSSDNQDQSIYTPDVQQGMEYPTSGT